MLDFFKFIECLVLKLNFSNVVVILPGFCMLVEERGIFITILQPKTTCLYSPVFLFSSQRKMEILLKIDLYIQLELIDCYMYALYLLLLCKLTFLNGLSKLGSRKMVKDCMLKILFILAWMVWLYDDVPHTNTLLHVGYVHAYG